MSHICLSNFITILPLLINIYQILLNLPSKFLLFYNQILPIISSIFFWTIHPWFNEANAVNDGAAFVLAVNDKGETLPGRIMKVWKMDQWWEMMVMFNIYIYRIYICIYIYVYIYMYIYIYVYIYIYGYNVFHRPRPVFSSILYMCTFQNVSEMLCTFQRCCSRVRDVVHVSPAVVHVSQKLCTCHRSCARFTSPLKAFVLNCIHTERLSAF